LAYEICRSGFEGRVLFTCEEEIGRSWQAIQTVLERDRLDHVKLIVLDTSPFDTEEQESLDFVILRHRDAHSLFDPYLTEALETCARSAKIPFVYKDRWLERQPRDKPLVSYGSTELGRLIKETAGRWNGTTLQIPTIGYHTNRETASFKAIENFWLLLTTFLLDH
jgi:putative aminopeptidase FrvX